MSDVSLSCPGCTSQSTSVNSDLNAAACSPLFGSSAIPTVNCTTWSRFIAVLLEVPDLHDPQFNSEVYCTAVLHKLHVRTAATLMYDL